MFVFAFVGVGVGVGSGVGVGVGVGVSRSHVDSHPPFRSVSITHAEAPMQYCVSIVRCKSCVSRCVSEVGRPYCLLCEVGCGWTAGKRSLRLKVMSVLAEGQTAFQVRCCMRQKVRFHSIDSCSKLKILGHGRPGALLNPLGAGEANK